MKSVIKKHGKMILASVLFFNIGCVITMSFLRLECVNADTKANTKLEIPDAFGKVEYAVLILSSPDNVENRNTIRTTWAKLTSNIFSDNGELVYQWNHTSKERLSPDVIHFFYVIGTQNLGNAKLTKLNIENDMNNDLLLLESFEDSYQNLATKVMHALQWFSNNLSSLKYVIKCDDDSFVRIDLIVHNLYSYAPDMDAPETKHFITSKTKLNAVKGLYWGYFNGAANVFSSGPWQEKDWFLCDHYLPYALGGGYVISRYIVDYLASNADYLSQYKSEDASMGVWTASLDNINRVHDIRFDTEWKSRGCEQHMLVRHKQSLSEMMFMYKTLVDHKGKVLCEKKIVFREPYLYRWDVLPSKCCRKHN